MFGYVRRCLDSGDALEGGETFGGVERADPSEEAAPSGAPNKTSLP